MRSVDDHSFDIAGSGRTGHEEAVSMRRQVKTTIVGFMQCWHNGVRAEQHNEVLGQDAERRNYQVSIA